jgi:hypothetical protein
MLVLKAKFDSEFLELSEGYVKAIENLLIEEIKMMRKNDPKNENSWEVGGCKIKDLGSTECLEFSFGAKEDEKYIKEFSNIYVEFSEES